MAREPQLSIDLTQAGIENTALLRHAVRLQWAMRELDQDEDVGFLDLPGRKDLLQEIEAFAKPRRRKFDDIVQFGIGGSSLGGQALCRALLPPRHNDFVSRGTPRFHFADNIDPDSLGALLDYVDPSRTLFHVVSKSGGTLETAAQLHVVREFFSGRRGFRLDRNLVVTTGEKGILRDFAEDAGIPTLMFPENVGGRFSVFTASGLLVPALCGVPVARVLRGARRMNELCRVDAMAGPAGRLAALFYEHDQVNQRPIHVDLIYGDALVTIGDWFAQLWAESLGKKGKGPTPVVARGTTDQHSQLQLYAEGPDDKVYTLIRLRRFQDRLKIARGAVPSEISGRQLSDVFQAEAEGTAEALLSLRRPLVRFDIPKLTPEVIGELLFLRQLQTALAGALYRVNPFDQPGVEAGKKAAERILRGEQ